jgi:hypothetical protein
MARTAQSSNSPKSYELCLRRKPAATTEPTPAANIASSAGSGVVIGGVPGPDGGVPGPDGGVPGPDGGVPGPDGGVPGPEGVPGPLGGVGGVFEPEVLGPPPGGIQKPGGT